MSENDVAVVFTLDLQQPVEIGDFTAAFSGLGSQFERFIRREHPELEGEVKVFVKEVRKGSIVAELVPLIPLIPMIYQTTITAMDHSLIATEFVKSVSRNIEAFRHRGGRLPDASKSELVQVVDTVRAVAHDPGGRASLKSIRYRKTGTTTEFAMEFDSPEAQQVIEGVEAQYRELEAVTDFNHINRLLTFYQSNRRDTDRTGEKGIIEDISPKPLAVVYASDLAKERIKGEMLAGDRNIYKLGFFVDVNVQHKAGKPVAYRITAVRDVIELPDDD